MIRRPLLVTSLGLLLLFGCTKATEVGSVQVKRKLVATTQRSTDYNYLMYVPPTYWMKQETKWPLVVFLHGSGERGTDVSKVAAHGPPKQAAQGGVFPFVLISPQCPPDTWWDTDTLQAMLDKILREQGGRIDRDRIYITGLSMGGGGAWDWISRDPNPFAAAAIVCGAVTRVPMRIKDPVPVWAFHGEADDVVPPWITTLMIDQFKQAGGETRVTMYPGVNHGSWNRAYDEPQLWEWLLSHKKQPATAGRGKFVMPRTPTTQPLLPSEDWR